MPGYTPLTAPTTSRDTVLMQYCQILQQLSSPLQTSDPCSRSFLGNPECPSHAISLTTQMAGRLVNISLESHRYSSLLSGVAALHFLHRVTSGFPFLIFKSPVEINSIYRFKFVIDSFGHSCVHCSQYHYRKKSRTFTTNSMRVNI